MAKKTTDDSFEDLEKLAHDVSDIRPLTAPMRRRWNAALRTGEKMKVGRPRKYAALKSRIVPISITPDLLEKIDRYAKSAGITRSQLVTEGLQLRIKRKI